MSANETATVEIPVRMLHRYLTAYVAELSTTNNNRKVARKNRFAEADAIALWALLAYEDEPTGAKPRDIAPPLSRSDIEITPAPDLLEQIGGHLANTQAHISPRGRAREWAKRIAERTSTSDHIYAIQRKIFALRYLIEEMQDMLDIRKAEIAEADPVEYTGPRGCTDPEALAAIKTDSDDICSAVFAAASTVYQNIPNPEQQETLTKPVTEWVNGFNTSTTDQEKRRVWRQLKTAANILNLFADQIEVLRGSAPLGTTHGGDK